MPKRHPKLFFALVLGLMLVLPLAGSLLRWHGLPPGFGRFPATQFPDPEPGFNWIYFGCMLLVSLFALALLLFPKLFGFKGTEAVTEDKSNLTATLPWWFWAGLAMNLVAWIVMWGQFDWLGPLVHYTFVPLWWGFILVLDGLVYRRSGGHSLLANRPSMIAALALTSAALWLLFEYYNYFVVENWYYPDNQIFSSLGYRAWFTLCYMTVWPAVFEFYMLLTTFKPLANRYTNGPRVAPTTRFWWGVFLAGVLLTFGFGLLPYLLFFGVWVGPLVLTSATLNLTGHWTPFTPMRDGDWRSILLFALAGLGNGFFWEGWNYWSPPLNPSFWKYEVPFVDILHIFEMPALGFVGYLPFGIACLVLWLYVANFLGWDPEFESKPAGAPEPVKV